METAVSVIGLGKLGAPLAASLASKGLRVIGVDSDQQKVDAIIQGRAPVSETGLQERMAAAGKSLSATTNIEEAVRTSEVTFIVVGTPSEPDGGFSLRFVLPIGEAIGRAIRAKRDFHLVVLTSTVMPGTTGGPVLRALEEASGKRCGLDFGLCYGPEFIALGSVIHDFLNPDFLLIGESDPRSGDILENLYRQVCENQPAVARMNFVNAEITKLSVNTYVTAKISFANLLARICEHLPGADVDVVTSALGLDSRIGIKYLKGAISYGGPCFPRDNHAMANLARQVGAPGELAESIDHFNRAQVPWLADFIQRQVSDGGVVGILGLTYKPCTDVVEEAVGALLARELVERDVSVVAYDPSGRENAARVLGKRVSFAASAQDCIGRSDLVVVATAWPEFAQIQTRDWVGAGGPRTVLDCWRMLKFLEDVEGVRYLSLGIGSVVTSPRSAVSL